MVGSEGDGNRDRKECLPNDPGGTSEILGMPGGKKVRFMAAEPECGNHSLKYFLQGAAVSGVNGRQGAYAIP